MRLAIASLVACLLAAPAFAQPRVDASMPVIRASIANGDMIVRLDPGVLGSARSLAPRTVVVVGRDDSGRAVAETTIAVSRRQTYARTQLTPSLAEASTIIVLVR